MRKAKLKNNLIGILSFIFGLTTLIFFAGFIRMEILLDIQEAPNLIFISMFLFINSVGLITGLISLIRKGYKKGFSVLGTLMNLISPMLIFLVIASSSK